MAILICGGAGYIGSHTNKMLNKKGYETIVFDNLVYGHREAVKWGHFVYGDLKNLDEIEAVFQGFTIEAVLHFAAYAYVGESVRDPEKYYYNNVTNTLNLLHVMRKYGCNKIIFSSTCATYGEPECLLITEDMTQEPLNPYGATKLMVERILKDYQRAYGLEFVILRYFNAAGADPDSEIGEKHDLETHLIPLILDAANGKSEDIKVFGTDYDTPDGTCIRDYIHVNDLAEAHILALDYLNRGGASDSFNLGNEQGTSVLEVIQAVKKVTNRDFKVTFEERRPGDPAKLVGSSKKARTELGWKTSFDSIEKIVEDSWKWYKKINNKIDYVLNLGNVNLTQGFSGCKLNLKQNNGSLIVEKISSNLEYNARFSKQISKQIFFKNYFALREDCFTTPEIYEIYEKGGLKTFNMEFIFGKHLNNVENLSIDEQQKIGNIITNYLVKEASCPPMEYNKKDKTREFYEAISEKISSVFSQINIDVSIQSDLKKGLTRLKSINISETFCHGDFTLENMIYLDFGKIVLVDFLDSFYSHVWIDIAKLYQDLEAGWQDIRKGNIRESPLIHSFLKKMMDNEINKLFPEYAEYHYFLLALTLLRIVPYSNNNSVTRILFNKIKCYINKFNKGIKLGGKE